MKRIGLQVQAPVNSGEQLHPGQRPGLTYRGPSREFQLDSTYEPRCEVVYESRESAPYGAMEGVSEHGNEEF